MGLRWNEWVNGSGNEYIYFIVEKNCRKMREIEKKYDYNFQPSTIERHIIQKRREVVQVGWHGKWKLLPMWKRKEEKNIYIWILADGERRCARRDHFTCSWNEIEWISNANETRGAAFATKSNRCCPLTMKYYIFICTFTFIHIYQKLMRTAIATTYHVLVRDEMKKKLTAIGIACQSE